MPQVLLQTNGIILHKENSKDAQLRIELFSPSSGKLLCLQRLSKKNTQSPLDLFDEVHLELTPSKQGSLYFVKDSKLLHRPINLAKHYNALQEAANWSKTLRYNLSHTFEFADLYALTKKALNAWETFPQLAQTISLKTLYSYAKNEGLPIQQAWLNQLPHSLKNHTQHLLITPLTNLPPESPQTSLALEKIRSFLSHQEHQ